MYDIKIVECDDGDRSLESFKKYNYLRNDNNIHLIIMDYNMNRMNGVVATKEVNLIIKIKKLIQQKGYVDCLIVGYSSDYDKAVNEAFLNAGACCNELKPSSLESLRKLVTNYVFKQ